MYAIPDTNTEVDPERRASGSSPSKPKRNRYPCPRNYFSAVPDLKPKSGRMNSTRRLGGLKMQLELAPNENRKRVRRLMRIMELESLSIKPRISMDDWAHPVYPYLCRDLAVTRLNQVWATDMSYSPMPGGHIDLCAVINWHSLYSRPASSWRCTTRAVASTTSSSSGYSAQSNSRKYI